jgi:hypothetical protein
MAGTGSGSTHNDVGHLGTHTLADWQRRRKATDRARAEILGDPHRRIWEQHDESLEAFEKRVKAAAEAART